MEIDQGSDGRQVARAGRLIETYLPRILADDTANLRVELTVAPTCARFDAGSTPESFVLSSSRTETRRIIRVVGKSDRGVVHGAHELLKQSARGFVPDLDMTRTPFLRGREAIIGASGRPHPNLAVRSKIDFEYWPKDKLEGLIDMVDFFGMDRIELADEPCYYTPNKSQWPARSEIEAGIHTMLRRAHHNGQKTTMFMWGNVVEKEPGDSEEYKACFNDPEDAPRFERDRRRRMQYAGEIDRIITHWADPGGCQRTPQCDITVPQRETVNLWNMLRTVNPDLECFMNLWYLADKEYGRWRGYENMDSILKSGLLPPEVGLCTGGRYRPENTDHIIEAGRRTGVWCWYLADHEICPAVHVHLRRMKNYFSSLPKNIGSVLSWHTIDLCFETPVTVTNLYVAGRLMWDPTYDEYEALEEYLALIFGPDDVAALAAGVRAIENVRCHGTLALASEAHGAEHDTGCGEGSPDPARDYDLCAKALAGLASVTVDEKAEPRFPSVFTPAEYLELLRHELEQIRDVAHFRVALDELLAKTKEPSLDQLKALPAPSADWYFRTSFIEYLQIRGTLEKLGMVFEPLPNAETLSSMPDNVLSEW